MKDEYSALAVSIGTQLQLYVFYRYKTWKRKRFFQSRKKRGASSEQRCRAITIEAICDKPAIGGAGTRRTAVVNFFQTFHFLFVFLPRAKKGEKVGIVNILCYNTLNASAFPRMVEAKGKPYFLLWEHWLKPCLRVLVMPERMRVKEQANSV